ncbi:MAG: hypothetical protein ABI851_11030 [Saprospiraceae bacterium]
MEFIQIGRSFKTHGIKGEIEIEIEDLYFKWLLKDKIFFVYINGTAVPFWISDVKNESRLFIKIEDLDSPEQAKAITNKLLYADKSRIPKNILKQQKALLQADSLASYSIMDQQSGIKSNIISLQEFPSQLLAELNVNDKKVMIPIHEDFIIKIDEKEKILYLNLPEGIFEIG